MKRLTAFTLFILAAACPVRAQWIVYDPTMNVQQIIDQAANIAKYVQMINNQVQQIQTLTSQLNEFKNYEALFGNPVRVLLPTLQPLVNDLTKTELGQTLTTLEGAVNADLYIEDSPYNVEALLRDHRNVIVFSHAANTHIDVPDEQRARTWAEAEPLIVARYHAWERRGGAEEMRRRASDRVAG